MYEELDIYDEMKGFYPHWLIKFKEIDAVVYSGSKMLDKAALHINSLINNQFISKCDTETLETLENFLNIQQNPQRSIAQRRQIITSHFIGYGRFGAETIKEIVGVYTSSPCNVSYENGIISVVIARDKEDIFILDDCVGILQKRKPAQLKLDVIVSSPFEIFIFAGIDYSEYRSEVI